MPELKDIQRKESGQFRWHFLKLAKFLSLKIWCWLDTWRGDPERMMLYQNLYGRFYVQYLDGRTSHWMYFSTAKSYAKEYGGKVVWIYDLGAKEKW